MIHEYRRLRALGYNALAAYRAAITLEEFTRLESEGLASLAVTPDLDMYDDSYIDTCGESPRKTARLKEELHDRIYREGCWILVARYRGDIVYDCGGFIGDDYADSGYDVDARAAVLAAHDDYLAEKATELENRPTYALT